MPVSTDQTENKNGLASDNASPLKVNIIVSKHFKRMHTPPQKRGNYVKKGK